MHKILHHLGSLITPKRSMWIDCRVHRFLRCHDRCGAPVVRDSGMQYCGSSAWVDGRVLYSTCDICDFSVLKTSTNKEISGLLSILQMIRFNYSIQHRLSFQLPKVKSWPSKFGDVLFFADAWRWYQQPVSLQLSQLKAFAGKLQRTSWSSVSLRRPSKVGRFSLEASCLKTFTGTL